MSKKERNGKQHIKHSCRYYEPSEEEVRIKKYIDMVVVNGNTKSKAARECGITHYSRYILPTKELWQSLPEKGRASKYSYIKKMQTFSTAKANPMLYREIMLCLIDQYVQRDYEEMKRKADKYDAIMTLIK